MPARRRRKTPQQDSDYDGAWKEFLRPHLREILEKYLLAIAAAIDWSYPPQWSDKELSRVLRRGRHRPKSVDVLVKVRLLTGAEQWILLHLEIQSSREAGFEFRMFLYNSGLYHLGYNADELREVFRFMDWMMSLPEELSRKFEGDLIALEESLNMPYVTSVERIAEERGESRGEARGGAAVLLEAITRLCDPLPDGLEQRVRRLPIERLKELNKALFDFQSVQDLQAWLDAFEEPKPPAS
jgi:hypothetical protein